jgi:hypothetical protein
MAKKYWTDIPLRSNTGGRYNEELKSVRQLAVGSAGRRGFFVDRQGIWLGAQKFGEAPFSVDVDGNLYATSATVQGTIQSSTIQSSSIVSATIESATITGSTLQTSSSGQRIVIENDILEQFDSSGVRRVALADDRIKFYDQNGNAYGQLYADDILGILRLDGENQNVGINAGGGSIVSLLVDGNAFFQANDSGSDGVNETIKDLVPYFDNQVTLGDIDRRYDRLFVYDINFGDGSPSGIYFQSDGIISNVKELTFNPQSSAPSSPAEGAVYFDSGAGKLYVYNGSSWEQISSS